MKEGGWPMKSPSAVKGPLAPTEALCVWVGRMMETGGYLRLRKMVVRHGRHMTVLVAIKGTRDRARVRVLCIQGCTESVGLSPRAPMCCHLIRCRVTQEIDARLLAACVRVSAAIEGIALRVK